MLMVASCVAQYMTVYDLDDLLFFFFFQAEDGIRDLTVTGVQTCALPILVANNGYGPNGLTRIDPVKGAVVWEKKLPAWLGLARSEERRVGKECRSRWLPCQ